MVKKKITLTLITILACQLLVLGGRYVAKNGSTDTSSVSIRTSYTKGNPKARYRVTEYVDFQCAACRSALMLIDGYAKAYPKDFLIETKMYPLRSHAYGLKSATYAECASRQGQFWAMHDRLFETQPEWSPLKDAAAAELVFTSLAQNMGLDRVAFDVCLTDPEVPKKILAGKDYGYAKGVRSTPTFFINDEIIVGFSALQRKLNQLYPNHGTQEKAQTP